MIVDAFKGGKIMTKNDIVSLINNFETETWKYESTNELDSDMQCLYSIESNLKNIDDSNIEQTYNKVKAIIGVIRFKYDSVSSIIKSIPELEVLKKYINEIKLDSEDIINQYNYIVNYYSNIISRIRNLDFITNKYTDIQGKEGLFLAVESLKSLITNSEYRQMLDSTKINDILIDCIKLNDGKVDLEKIESKYKGEINKIWQMSLSEKIDEQGKFRMLFSNISGGSLSNQAELLMNRPLQSSCSMISSDFIATYGDQTRKIGFIYPSSSKIDLTSAYDLGSNVFDEGVKNKEKGTRLSTPQIIEQIGKSRALKSGEDSYSSTCYNEVLVDSKPCGIVILGLGENDLNIDYQDAKQLAEKMNLPLYYIDTMKYKKELSERDKEYIAFHSIMSYYGMSREQLIQMVNDNNINIYSLINDYKNQISEMFLSLKENGNLNKNNMIQLMSQIVQKDSFVNHQEEQDSSLNDYSDMIEQLNTSEKDNIIYSIIERMYPDGVEYAPINDLKKQLELCSIEQLEEIYNNYETQSLENQQGLMHR